MNNYLKLVLDLKDPNLEIDPKFSDEPDIVYINKRRTFIWHFITSPIMKCPTCHCVMNKNGFKAVSILHNHTSEHVNVLNIRKQKYICPKCKKTSLAAVEDVRPNDHISLAVKRAVAVELTETLTAKYIAKTYNVSFNSIQRASKLWFQTNQPRFSWLPQHIAFDDFKSGSFAKAGMSVIVVDILRHRLLDVIKDRTNIVGYFSQYNIEARRAVKTVTVDLFTPYRKAIHELFPNAVIIADRFHVVTQAYQALNMLRIKVMKQFKTDTPEYRQLKRFHRLILKDSNDLNYETRTKRINYRYAYLSDSEIVDRILALSPELRVAYEFYQDIIYALKQRDGAYLANVLHDGTDLPPQMMKARRTIQKVYTEILNSFTYGFSNGPVEGMNNKIKVIKRIGYGFRNFENFRQRILIAFKNSFFAMNYKKATSSNFELVA